jgi:hypothetical protein
MFVGETGHEAWIGMALIFQTLLNLTTYNLLLQNTFFFVSFVCNDQIIFFILVK